MRKALSRPLALGVAAYLFFMVVSAPAAKLLPLVQSQLQGAVLTGVDGTLWSGNAASVTSGRVQLSKVSWQFHPLMLLTGRIEYSLTGQVVGGFVEADAGTGLFSDPYLADVEGRVAPGEALNWLNLNKLQAVGQLDFSFERIIWKEQAVPELEGKLVWGAAMITLPLELSLGTVELGMHTEDAVLHGQLNANGGALQGDGTTSMDHNGAYRLNANLRQSGDVPPVVEKFLTTFAEYNNGTYRVEWSDTF